MQIHEDFGPIIHSAQTTRLNRYKITLDFIGLQSSDVKANFF